MSSGDEGIWLRNQIDWDAHFHYNIETWFLLVNGTWIHWSMLHIYTYIHIYAHIKGYVIVVVGVRGRKMVDSYYEQIWIFYLFQWDCSLVSWLQTMWYETTVLWLYPHHSSAHMQQWLPGGEKFSRKVIREIWFFHVLPTNKHQFGSQPRASREVSVSASWETKHQSLWSKEMVGLFCWYQALS